MRSRQEDQRLVDEAMVSSRLKEIGCLVQLLEVVEGGQLASIAQGDHGPNFWPALSGQPLQ